MTKLRRLRDQVMILDGIAKVRAELHLGMNGIEQAEVMERLVSLYALLDVERLKGIAKAADTRKMHRKVA